MLMKDLQSRKADKWITACVAYRRYAAEFCAPKDQAMLVRSLLRRRPHATRFGSTAIHVGKNTLPIANPARKTCSKNVWWITKRVWQQNNFCKIFRHRVYSFVSLYCRLQSEGV